MPDAQTWVLLPGTLCTGAVFDPMLDALNVRQANRRTVTVDAPDVGDYAGRLTAAVSGGEIVCGFSLGALVLAHNLGALQAARALVLLASNPHPDAPGTRPAREAVRDRVLAGGAREWVTENWSLMSATNRSAVRDRVISMAEETTDLIPAQTELAITRPGAAVALAETGLPLLFVTGSDDQMTPPARIRDIAARATNAHLTELAGLGHFALIEDPRLVAQAVEAGLERITAKESH